MICTHCGKETGPEPEKTYILHWRGNMRDETITGRDIADALRKAGLGGGAMRALDYWEERKEK